MRILIAFLLTVLSASAAHVQWFFSDFTSNAVTSKDFRLYPHMWGTNGSGKILTRDWVYKVTDTNGSIIVSNVMGGTNWEYQSELKGAYATTTNWYVFPVTNGLINAHDYAEASPRIVDSTAYSKSASDSRFIRGLTNDDGSITVGTKDANGVINLRSTGGGGGISASTATNIAQYAASQSQIPIWQVTNVAGIDSNAMRYAYAAGITDAEGVDRINRFVRAIRAAGIESKLSDILILRTNLNRNLISFYGAYITNHGAYFDKAGGHTDGAATWFEWPVTIPASFTLTMLYAGDPAFASAANPWGAWKRSGANGGAVYINGNGGQQERLAFNVNGSVEYTDASRGWFMTPMAAYSQVNQDYLQFNCPLQRMLSYRWDNAGTVYAWADNSLSLYTNNIASRLTNSLDCVTFGAALNSAGAATGFWKGNFALAAVWNTTASSNEVYSLQAAFRYLMPGKKNVVFVGDSMTTWQNQFGYNVEPVATNTYNGTNIWGIQLLGGYPGVGSGLGESPYDGYSTANLAHSGFVTGNYGTTALNTWYGNWGPSDWVSDSTAYVWIGINDIGQLSNAGTTYTNLQGIWSWFKNRGFKVVAFTLPNVGTVYSTNTWADGYSTNTVSRAAYNAYIRSNPGLYDKLVDLDYAFNSTAMGTNQWAPHWSYDGLHMSAVGQNAVVTNILSTFPLGYYSGVHSGDGGSLTNINGVNIQSGTVNSNALDTATKALLGAGGGGSATNVYIIAGSGSVVTTNTPGSVYTVSKASEVLTNNWPSPASFKGNSLEVSGSVFTNFGSYLNLTDVSGSRTIGMRATTFYADNFVQYGSQILNSDGSLRLVSDAKLGTNRVLQWSQTADASGTADAQIAWAGTHALKVTDGSTGVGSLSALHYGSASGLTNFPIYLSGTAVIATNTPGQSWTINSGGASSDYDVGATNMVVVSSGGTNFLSVAGALTNLSSIQSSTFYGGGSGITNAGGGGIAWLNGTNSFTGTNTINGITVINGAQTASTVVNLGLDANNRLVTNAVPVGASGATAGTNIIVSSGVVSLAAVVTNVTSIQSATYYGDLSSATNFCDTLAGCGTIALSANTWYVPLASLTPQTVENRVQTYSTRSGVLRNLYILNNATVSAGTNCVCTVRTNGVDTGITCTLTSAGNNANDTSHTAIIPAGTLISIKFVNNAHMGTVFMNWSVQY